MSSNGAEAAIPSAPVVFVDGEPLPADETRSIEDPQNIWATLELADQWNAINVLGLYSDDPYKEPEGLLRVEDKVRHADMRREDDEQFTDKRNLSSFGALIGVHSLSTLTDEFRDQTVVDIGSGAGLVGQCLRQSANAHVIEVDASSSVMATLQPMHEGLGQRIVDDGTNLSLADATADKTISMYSTSVHTDTVQDRLNGISEAIRITRPGGRAFVVPLFGNLILRQHRWHAIQQGWDLIQQDEELLSLVRLYRQEAAIDHAVFSFVRHIAVAKVVDFTPVVQMQKLEGVVHDGISAVFDVKQSLTKPEMAEITDPLVAEFK